jgi:prepilin signal peptidase PulO-like enzyme (type II secretory pathway)
VLGGAPVLFLIWLLDPRLIGGGDWKLLAVSSAALGLLLPIAAAVASLIACLVQFVRFAALRERSIPFGPAIAAGMLVALALVPTVSHMTGGEFA